MKPFLLSLLIIYSTSGLLASPTSGADSAYLRADYALALRLYEQNVRPTADVYYNLGNAHYRLQQWPQAVVAYERALLLDPRNSDAEDNLALARLNTEDAIIPDDDAFLASLWWHTAGIFSVGVWQWMGVALFIIALCLFLVRRRATSVGAVVAMAVCAFANVAALTLQHHATHSPFAIVMSPAVNVTATASPQAKARFVLHAGTRVEMTDTTLQGWTSTRLTDGREGWVPDSSLTRLVPLR